MIEEIAVPDSLTSECRDDFDAYVQVRNDVEAATLGSDVLRQTSEELLPRFTSNPQRARRLYVVRDAGLIVGRAMVTSRPHIADAAADLVVDVLPAYRGRGLGAALLDQAESVAKASGCTVLQCIVMQASRPEDDAGGRFLRSRGYVLEQTSRVSVLDLEAFTRPRYEVAGDFRIHIWEGVTPRAWLDAIALLRTRMSIDPPTAGLKVVPDEWDAARILEHDAREMATGRRLFTAAVEHRLTGELVGFTELAVSPSGASAMQGATIVLREHRGQRLGMSLKAAALEAVIKNAPKTRQVVTFNADENRAIWSVNEALGFRVIGFEGAWQKMASEAWE